MAFLTFIARDHRASFQLIDDVTLGSSYDCDIFVPDVFVSRKHCRFEKKGQTWKIVDLASQNGIFFKGRRILQRELHHEDVVELGSVALIFSEDDMESPSSSTAMPYGKGSQITELIDTLYAGETRPSEYLKRNGRKRRGGGKSPFELALEEADELPPMPVREEPPEWTELDVEFQVAAMDGAEAALRLS